MKGACDDGRAGSRANVGLTADCKVENGRAQQPRNDIHERSVTQDPCRADGEQTRVIAQRAEIHVHADARDQDVEQDRADLRRAYAFETPRRRERQQHPDRRREHDDPEEVAGE